MHFKANNGSGRPCREQATRDPRRKARRPVPVLQVRENRGPELSGLLAWSERNRLGIFRESEAPVFFLPKDRRAEVAEILSHLEVAGE